MLIVKEEKTNSLDNTILSIPEVPKVEEEILPAVETVAELKAWVDNKNYLQDVDLSRIEEDLRVLENNVGFVKVDDRSFAEVIDETFAKKTEIPSIENLATKEEIKNMLDMGIFVKTLKYFIDIHRDSVKRDVTTTTIGDLSYAKVMFVLGLENDNYLENISITKDEFFERLQK